MDYGATVILNDIGYESLDVLAGGEQLNPLPPGSQSEHIFQCNMFERNRRVLEEMHGLREI